MLQPSVPGTFFGSVDPALGVVKYQGNTYTVGTAMPAGPVTGDHIWRADLNLEFVFDGTRWLSAELFRGQLSTLTTGFTVTTASVGITFPHHTTFDLWIENFYILTFVSTTNTGTQYWTTDFQKRDTSAVVTVIGTANTSADAANAWVSRVVAVNALLTPATYPVLALALTKVSTPGSCTTTGGFTYRLVGV